jgi:hypothetical protein
MLDGSDADIALFRAVRPLPEPAAIAPCKLKG